MGTFGKAEHGCLDNGGTLDGAVLFLFDRDSCDDCPLPIFFNDLPAIDFILGSFGCEGSMTDVITVSRLIWMTQKSKGVTTDLFCTGVIGHPGYMFLN